MMNRIEDPETLNLIRYCLGVYRFRDTQSGFLHLSAYLAGLSFEKVIRQYAKMERLPTFWSLRDCVEELLQRRKLPISYLIAKECVDFRNTVMHDGTKKIKRIQIESVLKNTCFLSGLQYYAEKNKRNFEDLHMFDQSDRTRARPRSEYLHNPIKISDFDNFYNICKKVHELRSYLELQFSMKGYNSLFRTEDVPQFIRTSGATWLPIVLKDAPRRGHIKGASIGAAFTPNDIRLGIDFGERAYRSKRRYYRLLLDGDLDDVLLRLGEKGYVFCDTRWYYIVRNTQQILEVIGGDRTAFEREIQALITETEDQEIAQDPITANKFIVANVLSRDLPGFSDHLNKLPTTILEMIEDMRIILEKITNSKS